MSAPDIYASPQLVTDIDACYFYHTIDLPGIGTVKGNWDLRSGLSAYLGHLQFYGKRVLDVGAANGLLSFFMEDQGAEVVSFDLDATGEWDLVPFAGWHEYAAIAEDRKRIMERLNNAYWFGHRLRESKARVVYGSVYRIPEEIGPVDVAVYGSILLHLRDPFLALQNGLRLAREAVVVTELLPEDADSITGPALGFKPNVATQEPKDTWWDLRPEAVVQMVGVLGFEDTEVTHHIQKYEGRDNHMYTVVGRRTSDGVPRSRWYRNQSMTPVGAGQGSSQRTTGGAASVVDDTIQTHRLIEDIRRHLSLARQPLAPAAPLAGDPRRANGSAADRRDQDLAILRGRVDPFEIRLQSHRKIFGGLVVAAKKLLRQLLTPLLEWQAASNAAVLRLLESFDHDARSVRAELDLRTAEIGQRLTDLQRRVTTAESEAGQRLGDLGHRLGELGQRVGELGQHVGELGPRLGGAEGRLDTLEAVLDRRLLEIDRVQQAMGAIAERVEAHRQRVARAERTLRRLLHERSQATTRPESEASGIDAPPAAPARADLAGLDFDYFTFEERYRGSEAEIRRHHRRYLRHVAGQGPILDIGCGRGEFLELLREGGIAARGVDADLDMVLLCRDKGLDVVHDDLFRLLDTVADGSLGTVFSSQVIEHLAPAAVLRLVDGARRKLRPGGMLILETINPRCLTVFARSFFLDPSHVWPCHPDTMRFVLETRGFTDIETEFFNPVVPESSLPSLAAAGPGPADEGANRRRELLDELVFGHQDYAIIGRTPLAEPPDATAPR